MIDAELLALLRCPESKQTLATASAELLALLDARRVAGTLRNRSGAIMTEAIKEGLVREDGSRFYLVRDGIPILIAAEGLDV